MKPDLTEATLTTGKKEYVIHPTDDLEFVPEAIIITRAMANGLFWRSST